MVVVVVLEVVAVAAADASAVFNVMVPLLMGGLLLGVGVGVGLGCEVGMGALERVMVEPMAGLLAAGEVVLSVLPSAKRPSSQREACKLITMNEGGETDYHLHYN